MTSRALPLALAALLAAACDDVSKYAPKTDADCGAGLRACGYKCVPIDDPATGCWETTGVCTPCATPPGAHTVAACETVTYSWPTCGSGCVAGWGDCDGTGDGSDANGCETNLATTAAHCGACNRVCATCTAGLCPVSNVGSSLTAEPVDLDQVGGEFFLIDQGNGGALRKLATPDNLDYVTGLGTVRRVRMVTATQGWVSGTETLSGTTYGTLWKIDKPVSAITATWWDSTVGVVTDFSITYSAPGVIDQIAWADSNVTGYRTVDPTNSLSTGSNDWGDVFTALAGDPTGYSEVYSGGPYTGGTGGMLFEWTLSGGSGLGLDPIPSRIAAFVDAYDTVWIFSASNDDGSVSIWRGGAGYLERVIPGDGPTSDMDIHADADGVYWCDPNAGVVREWRANDGSVFDVARGGWPVAVTSDGTRVVWADAFDWEVKATPK